MSDTLMKSSWQEQTLAAWASGIRVDEEPLDFSLDELPANPVREFFDKAEMDALMGHGSEAALTASVGTEDPIGDFIKMQTERSILAGPSSAVAAPLHKRTPQLPHPDGIEIRSYEDGAYFRNFFEGGVLVKAEYHDEKGKVETYQYDADGQRVD